MDFFYQNCMNYFYPSDTGASNYRNHQIFQKRMIRINRAQSTHIGLHGHSKLIHSLIISTPYDIGSVLVMLTIIIIVSILVIFKAIATAHVSSAFNTLTQQLLNFQRKNSWPENKDRLTIASQSCDFVCMYCIYDLQILLLQKTGINHVYNLTYTFPYNDHYLPIAWMWVKVVVSKSTII